MAKTPVPKKKKRNPQDATRARDVAPIRRRIERLEAKLAALEAWASTLVNPDTAIHSFVPPSEDVR